MYLFGCPFFDLQRVGVESGVPFAILENVHARGITLHRTHRSAGKSIDEPSGSRIEPIPGARPKNGAVPVTALTIKLFGQVIACRIMRIWIPSSVAGAGLAPRNNGRFPVGKGSARVTNNCGIALCLCGKTCAVIYGNDFGGINFAVGLNSRGRGTGERHGVFSASRQPTDQIRLFNTIRKANPKLRQLMLDVSSAIDKF